LIKPGFQKVTARAQKGIRLCGWRLGKARGPGKKGEKWVRGSKGGSA